MRAMGLLRRRRRRRGIRTDEIESRVSDDYHLMTLAIIAISTVGGVVVMWQNRRLGRVFNTLSLATLAERAWLIWYLGTRPDPNKELAITIDAATLAASMVASARLSPPGQYCSPWGTIAGSSTPAYPHLGGKRAGWAGTALLSAGTVLGFHLNGHGTRDVTLRGVSDGLAHVRGAALSVAAAASFRYVAEHLSEVASQVEAQQVATSSAAEASGSTVSSTTTRSTVSSRSPVRSLRTSRPPARPPRSRRTACTCASMSRNRTGTCRGPPWRRSSPATASMSSST